MSSMAKTASRDPFALTDDAVHFIASADPHPVTEARHRERPARPAKASRTKREQAAKSKTVFLFADQMDLLRELEYRSKGEVRFSSLAREAIDEYLIAHGRELGLTNEELEDLRSNSR